MHEIQIIAMPAALAEVVRRTRRDEYGNHDLAPQVVDEAHSAPCRVCLRDAEIGEHVLLLGYSPFATPHPYRTVGPIFIHAAECTPFDAGHAGVPDALRRRSLSVRAHDRAGRMLDCEVTPGEDLIDVARHLLALPEAHELHVHHVRAGCFACRIMAS